VRACNRFAGPANLIRSTNMPLLEVLALPMDMRQALRRDAERRRDLARKTSSVPSEPAPVLEPAKDAWPEVMAELPNSSEAPPTPEPVVPADWLRQSALRGTWLDVVCRCPPDYYKGRYNGWVGTIKGVPQKILPGDKGVVEVWLGPTTEVTKRKLKVQYLFPLVTTEFPPHILPQEARSIMGVVGMQVVVIGPNIWGENQFLGHRGLMAEHGITFAGHPNPVPFHVTSLCRSDGRPAFKT
jgi:hypothetical protein